MEWNNYKIGVWKVDFSELDICSWFNSRCVFLQVKRDDEHKMVKSKDVKDEEVARVPIAFAMIQLMKSLPKDVMEANLPGYVYSIITCFLNTSVC